MRPIFQAVGEPHHVPSATNTQEPPEGRQGQVRGKVRLRAALDPSTLRPQ